jgi:hypothetical protein
VHQPSGRGRRASRVRAQYHLPVTSALALFGSLGVGHPQRGAMPGGPPARSASEDRRRISPLRAGAPSSDRAIVRAVRDTSPASESRYFDLLRAQTPVERLQVAARLSRAVRELAETAVRMENPSASEPEIRWQLARRMYGERLANRFFRPVTA